MDFFDLFISFIFSFLRYFMIAYFIFQIFGRRRKIGVLFLSGVIIYTLAVNIYYMYYGMPFNEFLIWTLVETVPVVGSLVLFLRLTRAYREIKEKDPRPLKLKKVHSTIYPKNYISRLSKIGGGISIVVLIILIVDVILHIGLIGTVSHIIFFILTGAILAFSIYQIYTDMNLEYDRILLYVGKYKERCFQFDLSEYDKPMSVLDIYKNDDYIIDEMGKITVKEGMHTVEKNYIYWIATSTEIDINEEGFDQITKPFADFIDDVSKYQKINLKLNLDNGKYYE